MLSNNQITKHFPTYVYSPTTHTTVLWWHQTRPTYFTLVVDNFGVNYVGQQQAERLLDSVASLYLLTTDWEGKLYCVLTLNCDYSAHTMDLTMP